MSDDELTTTEPPELENNPSQGGDIDLDMLLDVPVVMTVEVGRKSLPIRDLLALTPGAVVTFDRSVPGPMDGMINGTLIARGEVVSADGQFGLRLVDVVSTKARLEQLG